MDTISDFLDKLDYALAKHRGLRLDQDMFRALLLKGLKQEVRKDMGRQHDVNEMS